ncbi:hypothetical protein LguiB_010208 [Lonicera macranthoides]
MMKGVAVTFLVVLAMVQFMAKPGQAITCGQVSGALAPCMSYLTEGGDPSQACCTGITNLKNMTPSQADRQQACQCVKDAAAKYPNLKPDNAASLPKKCNVPVNIPISPTTNCAK